MTADEFKDALKGELDSLSPLKDYLKASFKKDASTAADETRALAGALGEKGRYTDVKDVYLAAAEANRSDRSYRDRIGKEIAQLFSAEPEQAMFLIYCAFDNRRLKPAEPVRRLSVLQGLADGAKVYDRKSWGFGLVTGVSHAEQKVDIDFVSKPGHQLGLAYAAEVLDVLDDAHVLSRQHADPDAVAAQIKDDPGGFVLDVLKSFGPKSAPLLQEIIVPAFVEEAGWKKFWDAARKKLKQDPLVEFPAKRNDPILLLQNEKTYDDEWVERVSSNSDMRSILAATREYIDHHGKKLTLSDRAREIFAHRLGFVIHGSEGKEYSLTARGILLAQELGLTAEEVNATGFISSLKDRKQFLKVLSGLLAKELRGILAFLVEQETDATLDLLLDTLNEVEYTAATESISLLRDQGREEAVANLLRGLWNRWELNEVLLYWLCNNLSLIEEWKLGRPVDIAPRLLRVIEGEFGGARLRTVNQIKAQFAQPAWLQQVMGEMDARQRRQFTQGVKDSSAWQQLDKASVLGHIVKTDGSMQDIVSGRSGRGEAPEAPTRGPITSQRSYAERQAQLDKIVKEDIPQNSKDIGVAREYGDLRENFEYKAAKDQQRILMQREAELETMLRSVTPTDFEGFSSDVADIATTVALDYGNGQTETYTILGEWDSDEGLGIISCNSRMALALQGHGVGDEVTVPAVDGEATCRITSVSPLSEELVAWING